MVLALLLEGGQELHPMVRCSLPFPGHPPFVPREGRVRVSSGLATHCWGGPSFSCAAAGGGRCFPAQWPTLRAWA